MTIDELDRTPRCSACGLAAHPGMRFEKIFARGFNGLLDAMARVASLGKK